MSVSPGVSSDPGLTVTVQGPAYADVLDRLVRDKVASRVAAKDTTLWGEAAESEASVRLGWVDLARTSRPLLAEIDALRASLRADGIDRVVLCGMGGSSLAPEVITAAADVELTVLDSTDPGVVRRALEERLDRTVVVVSSKSGGTVETDSQRRAYVQAFTEAGIDAASRIVVVTDPGSPLAELAEREGYRRTFLADPNVGGRYSALTAFGLVPAGLAGADVSQLLDDAEDAMATLAEDSADNPALVLGAVLGGAHEAGREKVVLGDHGSDLPGFAAWTEQLVAESTGKEGRGLLPVDAGGVAGPGWRNAGDDCTPVAIGLRVPRVDHVSTAGPLGALMLLWETAVVVAGRVIGIDPFDQPNVEEAKKRTRELLDEPAPDGAAAPALVDGAVEVYADADLLAGARTLREAVDALAGRVPDRGYLAVLAYLDRVGDAEAERLRVALAERLGVQVTFGWGPRFLHSTGQYHKGGHPNGGFLEITGAVDTDLDVPDRPYTFGRLIAAQAAGDYDVLHDKGFPVVRLHLTYRTTGLRQLLAAIG
ncbi:MAG: glucose-6-phosphate isomerase [Streptosporangiales bacterium]|nr:glucose-6-phosphate isomerase [Streptosporangiales bacterium]